MPSQTYQQLLEELKQTGIYEKSTDAGIMDAYMEVLDGFIKAQLQHGEDPRTIAEGLNLHCKITKPEAHEYVQMVVAELNPAYTQKNKHQWKKDLAIGIAMIVCIVAAILIVASLDV